MVDDDSDEILMLRVARADHAACQRLVERHLPRIHAFAYRTLGDRSAAEDIAQEVFARVWTHARTWQPGRARLTTWLHRVALNLCLDHRARKREEGLEGVPEPCDPGADAAAQLQERALRAQVAAALRSLPESQQAAITLCHYQGFRNREAADILGVSVEALESLLARGRRTLRERLRANLPALLADD
jgi:RNA polymerase sigma-70 factor, ECF subfamily